MKIGAMLGILYFRASMKRTYMRVSGNHMIFLKERML
jgi:hypothetical protein